MLFFVMLRFFFQGNRGNVLYTGGSLFLCYVHCLSAELEIEFVYLLK